MGALPKIDLPLYELELPSSQEKVKYRPFTVKEEKILLVAQEANDTEQEILAAKQIINNCLIDTDVGKLPMFDLEYIMMTLRARSVDNMIQFAIKDPDTQEQVELTLDIEKVKVVRDKNHTNKIRVNDDYYLFLKYPTIDEFVKISKLSTDDPLANYFVMVSCLDTLASEDEVYEFSEYSEEEIDNFMESMGADVVKGIQSFFETMPKLRHEIPYTNSAGKEQTFVLEGMRSFFI